LVEARDTRGARQRDRQELCGVANFRIELLGRPDAPRSYPSSINPSAEGVAVTKEDIEAAALQLPERERARLAELLLSSLDEEDEIAAAWADEAERRFEELKSGRTKALPADEVLERIRSRLR